jgi:hypothetical protein
MDDKFPCMVVRSRKRTKTNALGQEVESDELRLVNVGRGPAFITKFKVKGLDKICPAKDDNGEDMRNEKGEIIYRDYEDGDHTDGIDKVIGPDVGDPDLQCWFAWGTPHDLRVDSPRPEKVSIGIAYKDIGGREFRSGIIDGKPVWDPPLEFSHTRLCIWLQNYCGKEEPEELVKRLRAFLGMATR